MKLKAIEQQNLIIGDLKALHKTSSDGASQLETTMPLGDSRYLFFFLMLTDIGFGF